MGPSGILPRRRHRQSGASVVTAQEAVGNRTEIPIMSPKKLTDTQLVLLSAAAQREDGAVELAGNPKGTVAKKAITKLLNDRLVEEVPAGGTLPVWRRDADRGALGLRITDDKYYLFDFNVAKPVGSATVDNDRDLRFNANYSLYYDAF